MKPKYVILEGLEHGNKFFSLNTEEDPTLSAKGEVWYKVIGYAETVAEAQTKLFGKSFTTALD